MRAASAFLALAFATIGYAAPVTPATNETLVPITIATDGDLVATYTQCNRPNVYALTFDDGPFEYSWNLAKYLNSRGVKATFFTNGHNYFTTNFNTTTTPTTDDGPKTYTEVLQLYDSLGMEIGSHTYEHVVLSSTVSETEIEYQLNTQSDLIFNAIGKRPALFRPPEGVLSTTASSIVKKLGYSNIMWDVDTKDYEEKGLTYEQGLVREVVDKDVGGKTLGHISLQHDVHPNSVTQLTPWYVDYILAKNYTLVTVSECLGISAYQ